MNDIRRIDKITSRRSVENKESYSDFMTNFNAHPETGKLMKNSNEAAIKRSLRNLILTNKGEAPYQPNKGSDLNKILFDPISPLATDMIRTYIKDVIKLEPRVDLIEVLVAPDEINNSYSVAIVFNAINNSNQLSLSLNLQRMR